jgi:hypothetical protein
MNVDIARIRNLIHLENGSPILRSKPDTSAMQANVKAEKFIEDTSNNPSTWPWVGTGINT